MSFEGWNWINWFVFSFCILFGICLLIMTVYVFWHVKNPNEKMLDRLKEIKKKRKLEKNKKIIGKGWKNGK